MATGDSSRPPLQDEAVRRLKGTPTLFFNLLNNFKGKTKDATVRESAKGYFEGLNSSLPPLFGPGKRWERSSLQGSWTHFVQVWNNGDCSWTTASEAFKPVAEGLQQSD
jgi:hypothetical protein